MGDPTKIRRYTIKAVLFLTAVVAGMIPAVLRGKQAPATGIFITGVYLTGVCGITTLVLHPRSVDAYIPLGGAIFLLAILFLTAAVLPSRMRDDVGEFLFFRSILLAIYLLIHNARRINKMGFSLVVSLYHFGFWVAWVGLTGAIANAPIT